MAKDAQNPEQEEQQQAETEIVVDTVAEITTVKNDDIFLISDFGGLRPYTNTTEESRNHGKFYRSFRYLNRSFTVNSEDKFCRDYDDENLEIVKLTESLLSDKGWEFLGHITITQVDKRHKSTVNRAFYTVANLKALKPITNLEDLA